MKTLTAQRIRCPKCGGRLFPDKDRFGSYEQCLQCGYIRNIDDEITAPTNVNKICEEPPAGLVSSSSTR